MLSHAILSLTDFRLILHHKSMSLSLSHLVTSFCPSHCAMYTDEGTNSPLLAEQNYTSFFMPVRNPISRLYHLITISNNLLMLFLPFASRSLGLAPDEVSCDTSNIRQQSVLTELLFETALQGMKF